MIRLEEVSYSYPGSEAHALHSVSLAIEPGEVVVLAGTSGSGKSTLLRAVNGLVPHFHGGVFSGRAIVGELDTREHGPGELAAVVGSLFQDPETQVVLGSVRAELAFGLENRGWPPPAVARAVEEAALALGVAHLLDRETPSLSGGELQRVALAAALAGRPSVLVLDEPTSQLDPVAGDELMGLLRRINEDFETTIVLCEQRLERCLPIADRVVALEGGRVVCDGTPGQFLAWAPPALMTPGASLLRGLGLSPVPGVRGARRALREAGWDPVAMDVFQEGSGKRPPERALALRFDRVWHELRDGPAILRGASLSLAAGEKVALMGRNGAGKSTLLRHAAGLMAPTRGKVQSAGRVALLLQNPGDYLVHERVESEASAEARHAAGLSETLARRHPRELSGGERQRLALAVVLDGPAAVVCLDEPTRGIDRGLEQGLAALLRSLDAAVLLATHDPEFAAAFADRVILLADGAPIADGPVEQILTGGTYFATETARICGALTPERAIARVQREPQEVPA